MSEYSLFGVPRRFPQVVDEHLKVGGFGYG
jgi:hypothetical protein